ncbi:metal ABC transporter ATP-binding protein [Rhabdochlamydiaceae symbiont of Dictyostelium giganteum]|uniref:metal ABC transporter ATP-binding protein n=1 Tax=Rhabdochlamydiaceae symbiont of Dictyostelium giganteum TaxID=3342349 RepID=UPI00384E846B
MTIQAKNLAFQYTETPLLHHVSFDIKQGECIAIFGPNGGGKTTLLKLLMGFLTPSSGSLCIEGAPPQKKRSVMGYVPQRSSFDPQFPITAIDVVKMGALTPSYLRSYPIDALDKAWDMLNKVGLTHLAEAPFGSLSGGQAQRVLIARALMGHREYLFLDEATANIDFAAQLQFHELLQELKGKLTIVMVTHDLPKTMPYVDRFLSVYGDVTSYTHEELCHHFVHGLYHLPLSSKG